MEIQISLCTQIYFMPILEKAVNVNVKISRTSRATYATGYKLPNQFMQIVQHNKATMTKMNKQFCVSVQRSMMQ